MTSDDHWSFAHRFLVIEEIAIDHEAGLGGVTEMILKHFGLAQGFVQRLVAAFQGQKGGDLRGRETLPALHREDRKPKSCWRCDGVTPAQLAQALGHDPGQRTSFDRRRPDQGVKEIVDRALIFVVQLFDEKKIGGRNLREFHAGPGGFSE